MSAKEHTLSSTAFLTAMARARREDISSDFLAHAWLPPEMTSEFNAFYQRYSQGVCEVEDTGLALRNRYFLGKLREFQTTNPYGVFINFAAGLSSYPFLLERSMESYEIDRAEIIEFKASRIKQLAERFTPLTRSVKFLEADLSDPRACTSTFETLTSGVRGRPTFVLLEGISYYLSPDRWQTCLQKIANLQERGSVLAFDFWPPSAREHQVFERLRRFYQVEFDWQPADFHLIDPDSLTALDGYSGARITNALAEEAAFFGKPLPQEYDATFLEHYAIFRREMSDYD